MSLINDALKRAAKAQPPATPAESQPTLPLQPAEPTSPARQGLGVALPIGLALVALLALFLCWRMAHLVVAAKSETPAPASTADSTNQASQAVAAAPASAKVPNVGAGSNGPGETATNDPTADVPPAKPLPPRLQGITYNPRNPSALIGGKTVFVGEHVGPYRVTAISRDSATVVGNGETNLLLLDR